MPVLILTENLGVQILDSLECFVNGIKFWRPELSIKVRDLTGLGSEEHDEHSQLVFAE